MFYKPLDNVVRDYVSWARSPHPRVPTGFPILDSRTSGGAANGEVILLTARSSVGKTAVACNVINNNCPRPTVMFSLEMASRYIAMRLAAIHSREATANIEWQLKNEGRCDALQALVDDFPFLAIPDEPAMSLKHMDQACDEIEDQFQQKIDLIVIDYMELIGGVPSLSAVEKVDGVARKVKDFARKRDAVVFLLHQVGRGEGGAGADPLSLDSGRYGGETQADYVMAAYRPCLRKGITQDEYMNERWKLMLQFLKTRGGAEIHPEGELYQINPFTMRIGEWSYEPLPLFPDIEPEPLEDAA